MTYYDDNHEDSKKHKYTIPSIIFACVMVGITQFFGYSETMTCTKNHCEIFRVRNINKTPILYKSFNEEDIAGFEVKINHPNDSEFRTETPIVILKDGSKITLHALETRNSARYITFNSLRNQKFPK